MIDGLPEGADVKVFFEQKNESDVIDNTQSQFFKKSGNAAKAVLFSVLINELCLFGRVSTKSSKLANETMKNIVLAKSMKKFTFSFF